MDTARPVPARHRVVALDRLADRPTRADLRRLDRRFGLYALTTGLGVGLFATGGLLGYDLAIYRDAAAAVAAGGSAYEGTLSVGVESVGPGRLYLYPPLLAHLLAPFAGLPLPVLLVAWTLLGLGALGLAARLIEPDALIRQVPRLALGLGALGVTLAIGQVNAFVLAGLLLAVGARDDRLAGLGLAAASLLRGSPVAFALLFVLERRWRALAWAGAVLAPGLLVGGPSELLAYLDVARRLAAVPPLESNWQLSAWAYGPQVAALVAALVGGAVLFAGRVAGEARLLRATAVGLGVLLLGGNSWLHWLSFCLPGLLVEGARAVWSRRAFLAFLAASWLPVPLVPAWPVFLVCLATLGWMCYRIAAASHREPDDEPTVSGRRAGAQPG